MKQNQVVMNLKPLDDMRQKLGGKMRARVGFIGRKGSGPHDDSGITVAAVALIHIFGSLSRNIPPRDCLIMPIERNRRQLIASLTKGQMRAAFARGDYPGMFKLMGIAAEGFVQDAFATGGWGLWLPLKQSTIDAKGSSSILINTARLRRSVSSDVVDNVPAGAITLQPLVASA